MTTLNYTHVTYPEPHVKRTQEIMKAHPEIKNLFGYTPVTAFWTLFLVIAQFAIAALVADASWWVILLVSYFVGAVICHALLMLNHDITHNLAFKTTNQNMWLHILANMPLVFPATVGFRRYHLLHHRYQGEMERDADLPGPIEAKIVGNSTFMKAMWLLNFWFIEGVVRPFRMTVFNPFSDPWILLNLFMQIVCVVFTVMFLGWGAFAFTALSLAFGIGLHPLGARWIQEHYIFKEGQETYSYYGPFNHFMFQVGHHNEHHDFMYVPWSRLPKIREIAPEFYNTLYYHTSYTKLLLRFIFDKNLSLYSRAVREPKKRSAKLGTLINENTPIANVTPQAQL